MKNVLFLNHRSKRCGVYQEGYRIASTIENSKKFNIIYLECSSAAEYTHYIHVHRPTAIIYNYYPSTLWWVNDALINTTSPKIKHIGIFHEVELPSLIPYKILLDPSATDNTPVFTTIPGKVFKTGRCLFDFKPPNSDQSPNEILTIGSFGFGFGNKGYGRIIDTVLDEFKDEPVKIRLHMPFAEFGDNDGRSSREQADLCRNKVQGTNIELEITHEFMETEDLLSWLFHNDLNCFFYEHMYGRGISGCIDYALTVEKPVAITDSYMFRHIRDANPCIRIEETTLRNILQAGNIPLLPYKWAWTHENLIKDYEEILEQVCTTES